MRIHEQVKDLNERRDSANELIAEFRTYLDGPKFRGHHPQDGTPNSYIATHEVAARLMQISDILNDYSDY